MKGTTHAAAGIAVGSIAALIHEMSFAQGAVCAVVGGIAALMADLDGHGMLANKLSRTSQAIHRAIIAFAFLGIFWGMYMYWALHLFPMLPLVASTALFTLAAVLKVGFIRNLMLSGLGLLFVALGWYQSKWWLVGLGLFIACAPWFKHRGFTHTIWCAGWWALLGWELERDIALAGMALSVGGGYASHLILDTMTPGGVKWLYPLMKRSFRF